MAKLPFWQTALGMNTISFTCSKQMKLSKDNHVSFLKRISQEVNPLRCSLPGIRIDGKNSFEIGRPGFWFELVKGIGSGVISNTRKDEREEGRKHAGKVINDKMGKVIRTSGDHFEEILLPRFHSFRGLRQWLVVLKL